ncbi:hypothetical protein SELMODRAFT_272267 [Selaginella moellendorffii]|uniref:PITH domain-containing protein n=1 Tax=Selaginella moellendorffii TaxID=88036 RepID=D8TA01_SELML|nr:PITH domain-containing protein At3g04780 [Selaginella moellendorffii]EFJ06578.1 hypothetical protein SELMODRAFT_272267 [Selaginella moellendorffii]|eukprot:XP_002992428.1 PITH domain-containing protein At3g04780 [Selaginella moellendorffii]
MAAAVSVAATPVPSIAGPADLVEFVDWSMVECLNESANHTHANALKKAYREDDELYLESDTDEQLLLYIPFNQVVKLHSVMIKSPADEGPKTVRLFANRQNMGFSNVGDFPPNDVITLTPEHLKGKPVLLKYVKFQNVRSVTVFIEDNQSGGEVTKLQRISLIGSTVETTNMSELKKINNENQ